MGGVLLLFFVLVGFGGLLVLWFWCFVGFVLGCCVSVGCCVIVPTFPRSLERAVVGCGRPSGCLSPSA